MQRIIPNIWCNQNADDARNYYLDVFSVLPGTQHIRTTTYPTTVHASLAGQTLTHELTIGGTRFILINAGDEFAPNPSISFFVNADPSVMDKPRELIDQLWNRLTDGGTVLMDLGEYPHSPHYGWVADKFGVNWQLMLTDPDGEPRPTIVPSLMFCGPAQNSAAEAVDHYVATLPESRVGNRVTYGQMGAPLPPEGPITADSVVFTDACLAGTWIAAMDSAVAQPFTFSEGVSLMLETQNQEELNRVWDALSAHPEAEQYGWLKDTWGVYWQVVPGNLGESSANTGPANERAVAELMNQPRPLGVTTILKAIHEARL